MAQSGADPRFVEVPPESLLRNRMQQAEQGHALRPGAVCPHCGGHAFRRQEIKRGAACPKCGRNPRLAA